MILGGVCIYTCIGLSYFVYYLTVVLFAYQYFITSYFIASFLVY